MLRFGNMIQSLYHNRLKEIHREDMIEFYTKHTNGFKPEMFNKKVLNLHNDNEVYIYGDRQSGSSTTLMLTVLFKCLFEHNQVVYIKNPRLLGGEINLKIIIEWYKNIFANCNFKSKLNKVIIQSCKSIEFDNGNKIILVPDDKFLDMTKDLSYDKDYLIVCDDYYNLKPHQKDVMNEGYNHLNAGRNVSRLFSN